MLEIAIFPPQWTKCPYQCLVPRLNDWRNLAEEQRCSAYTPMRPAGSINLHHVGPAIVNRYVYMSMADR
jgi:hypothetical protein